MTDVRLTAINPDDSSAVPVACNSKGELLLEPVPWFEGNVNGDLRVTGQGSFGNEQALIKRDGGAQFAGNVSIGNILGGEGTIIANNQIYSTGINSSGTVSVDNPTSDNNISLIRAANGNNSDNKHVLSVTGTRVGIGTNVSFNANDAEIKLNTDGSASFAGALSGASSATIAGELAVNSYNDGCVLFPDGGASFAGAQVSVDGNSGNFAVGGGTTFLYSNGNASFAGNITANAATFSGDVIIGSRNKQWMIVESNGIAHLVEQTLRSSIADRLDPERPPYPELRDIPAELTMIEQQLQKVLEQLQMTPEAGWEVRS